MTSQFRDLPLATAEAIVSMTTVERDSLTPVLAEIIFNTDTNSLNVFNGSSWDPISGGSPLRLPQMTTTERNALTASAGMLIFNTTNSALEYYNGSVWV